MDDFLVGVLANIGIVSFVALSAYVLLLAGEVSFGQQAFFGLGAYAAGMGTAMLKWPLAPALLPGRHRRRSDRGAASDAPPCASPASTSPWRRWRSPRWCASPSSCSPFRSRSAARWSAPRAPDGFGDIRYLFENEITPLQYMAGI